MKIASKYFDAIPQAPAKFHDIPHMGDGNPLLDGSEMLPDFDIPNIRTAHFVVATLEKKVEIAAKLMEYYHEKVASWDGTIEGLDLNKEASRLRQFPTALFWLMHTNGKKVDKTCDDTFEMGLTGEFKVQYVLLGDTAASPLRVGFEKFSKQEPIKFARTMGYLFYLDELTREARKKEKIGWIEFVQKYTFPVPVISPSKKAKNSPLASNLLKNAKEKAADKVSAKYDSMAFLTSKQKLVMDKELNSTTLKLDLASIRGSHVDFVGDTFVMKIPDIIKKLDAVSPSGEGSLMAALNAVYTEVLNKADIKTLASLGTAGMTNQVANVGCELYFSLVSAGGYGIQGHR